MRIEHRLRTEPRLYTQQVSGSLPWHVWAERRLPGGESLAVLHLSARLHGRSIQILQPSTTGT